MRRGGVKYKQLKRRDWSRESKWPQTVEKNKGLRNDQRRYEVKKTIKARTEGRRAWDHPKLLEPDSNNPRRDEWGENVEEAPSNMAPGRSLRAENMYKAAQPFPHDGPDRLFWSTRLGPKRHTDKKSWSCRSGKALWSKLFLDWLLPCFTSHLYCWIELWDVSPCEVTHNCWLCSSSATLILSIASIICRQPLLMLRFWSIS